MENFTIISYPGARDNLLLSLTESRSRYMLPFGGKFRVVDFTLRNSFSSGAASTVIYNNFEDGLEEYVQLYDMSGSEAEPPVRVVSREFSDLAFCHDLIMETNTGHYIIYNGDNPSIIDFTDIMDRFRKRRVDSLLFLLDVEGRASMAHKLLVTKKRTLLKVLNKALKENHQAPNIFEMIINIIVNAGIKRETFSAHYWPISNVPEYYNASREVIWNPLVFNLLYKEKIIQSKIQAEGYALIGEHAHVSNSFMSDYCHINGKVENSIIYPGVIIEERALVKDSIVLPFVRIGAGARIYRTIIDERTDRGPENTFPDVGEGCNIGTRDDALKNSDFPRSLFSSITLLGKNCRIPERSNIGGACYVGSGLGVDYFAAKRYLYDGLSVVK
ncbi:MAG: hypothetical protein CVV44_01280 [Spirochaetae bacterium HGW-Spirochaetae-1]|nr:MAG: hypothetical protein CVV44_01280 [Spirochaetae bacterium HGW-Spirochaetae-1]